MTLCGSYGVNICLLPGVHNIVSSILIPINTLSLQEWSRTYRKFDASQPQRFRKSDVMAFPFDGVGDFPIKETRQNKDNVLHKGR